MKKYEVIVEDDSAEQLTELLNSLPYVKNIKQTNSISSYTLASEEALSVDWLAEEDDDLQKMYKK
ncbi:MAG: hypothetical protein JWQ96_3254 [Segetibacter sp.]|nr:hypothetical protein [Segetibacter sp.]